jgi:hypothetical protein
MFVHSFGKFDHVTPSAHRSIIDEVTCFLFLFYFYSGRLWWVFVYEAVGCIHERKLRGEFVFNELEVSTCAQACILAHHFRSGFGNEYNTLVIYTCMSHANLDLPHLSIQLLWSNVNCIQHNLTKVRAARFSAGSRFGFWNRFCRPYLSTRKIWRMRFFRQLIFFFRQMMQAKTQAIRCSRDFYYRSLGCWPII